jgi:ArsR family transcriptional regulator, virulence genes transcriptional regulator
MKIEKLHSQASEVSNLLKVMANESRLQILCQLAHGEKSVTELEEAVGLRQSAISQHLAIMRRERIVKTRRVAQQIFYSLASEDAKAIVEALYNIFCEKKPKKK